MIKSFDLTFVAEWSHTLALKIFLLSFWEGFFFLEALSLLLGFQPFVNFELGYTQRKAFVGIDFNY